MELRKLEKPNIIIIDRFINNPDLVFNKIRDTVNWDERIKARKTASFGVVYNYSDLTYPEIPMLQYLIPICKSIETTIGFYPNNCLMNYYLDGNSKMGYHSDSTEELKQNTGVVIISLGATRKISYRNKLNPECKVQYQLKNGALLYMNHRVQQKWMHAIPQAKNVGERISLSFRKIVK